MSGKIEQGKKAASAELDWDVDFKIEDPPQVVHFTVEHELLLGRTPNGQAEMPSVDLTDYNGVELGVSRKHGIVTNDGTSLSYQDLGAGNGSVLNGDVLTPNEPVRISTGDILYLGHMKGEISLRARPRKTSILAMREELSFAGVPTKGTGQRILVVEDDQNLSEMFRVALERGGYVVQSARELVTAIRALNHLTPSAIMLDLMLPGIRGLELCRYVRRDTQLPSIPIIVVSALNDKESVRGAMEAGADVFIAKPVDWKELTRVISTLVYSSEAANPSMKTKRLTGTARLDFIPAETRKDTIVLFIDNFREPLTAVVQPQLTLGRQLTGQSAKAHVDLESYQAFDKGVSRVHATIRRVGANVEVEDNNSANGTFVNGYSLMPNQPHPLKNGDEIRLGGLRMHVYFLSETEISER